MFWITLTNLSALLLNRRFYEAQSKQSSQMARWRRSAFVDRDAELRALWLRRYRLPPNERRQYGTAGNHRSQSTEDDREQHRTLLLQATVADDTECDEER